MKTFITVYLLMFFCCLEMQAQFMYGTPVTKGNVTYSIKRTHTISEEGKEMSKEVSNYTISSKLLFEVLPNSLADLRESFMKIKHPAGAALQGVVIGDSYSETMAEGELPFSGKNPPMYGVTSHHSFTTYGTDPCYKSESIIPIAKGDYTVTYNKGVKVTVGIFKDSPLSDGFRLSLGGGNTPWQMGGDKIPFQYQSYSYDDAMQTCKWSNAEGIASGVPNTDILDASQQATANLDYFKRVGPATYKAITSDGTLETMIKFAEIDTAALVQYFANPKPTIFHATGTFKSVFTSGNTKEVTEEECDVTLTLGLVDFQVVISAKDEAAYHKWLPILQGEPGYSAMMVKATIDLSKNAKEDTLDFRLREVTDYYGICSNFPEVKKADRRADLFFSPVQPTNIMYIDSFHVKTKGAVKEAEVKVESRDYAAYGKVVVRALRQNIKGKSKYNSQEFFSVPEDDDFNKVADAWEEDMKMHQRATEWDAEGEISMGARGDNICFLDEYRGFMIKDGNGKKYQRMDPNKREIFVVDNDNVSNKQEWEAASDIMLYYLSDDLIQLKWYPGNGDIATWRTVNYNGKKDKKAIYIKMVKGLIDPENTHVKATCGYPDEEWGGHICFASGCDGAIHFFPDRITEMLKGYNDFVTRALESDGCKFKYDREQFELLAKNHNMTVAKLEEMAKVAIKKWPDPAFLASLSKEYQRFIIIHEMGHACRIEGHSRLYKADNVCDEDDSFSPETTQGNPSCPMAYIRFVFKQELVIFGGQIPPLMGKTRFCSLSEDNCIGKVSAKN